MLTYIYVDIYAHIKGRTMTDVNENTDWCEYAHWCTEKQKYQRSLRNGTAHVSSVQELLRKINARLDKLTCANNTGTTDIKCACCKKFNYSLNK